MRSNATMAPNSWLSLVLAPATKDALQICIEQVQAASPVPLDPMSNADMHMTLVFVGSNKRGLTPAKRAELDSLMEAFAAAAAAGLPFLEFEALELFPPAKRNQKVAKYIIDGANLAALRKLQVACYEAGLVSKEEHARSEGNDFVAHITLGKFRGMRADQLSSVDKVVVKLNPALDQSARQALELPFEAACLCGGG